MRFRQGMRVLTFDEQDVGKIEQVVMNPQTKELTHLVVKKGFLFTEDKIVPTSLVDMSSEDAVHLRPDAGNLDDLPAFEETHYVPLDAMERGELDHPSAPALYWVPPIGGWLGYGSDFAYPPPYASNTSRNIPEGSVTLSKGAEVYSSNGEQIGHVEEILTDARADRATYFVLSLGMLLPSKRLVPMSWVGSIAENKINLIVGKSIVERLKEYHPERP